MSAAINRAIVQTLQAGLVCSTTVMMPCAGALQTTQWLRENRDTAFGVHLTVICDTVHPKFGPLALQEKVPSLVDESGYFYSFERMPQFLAHAKLAELETEFRAQIEAVLAAQLKPTHLDWHCLRFGKRTDIFDLMFGLAKEYHVALRVVGNRSIQHVQSLGLPCNDTDFLDSFAIDVHDKPARYAQLLRDLPAGLSEWAVHPGLDNVELHALQPDGAQVRQSDFEFLMSPQAQQIVKEEGIVLLDYRLLQTLWNKA